MGKNLIIVALVVAAFVGGYELGKNSGKVRGLGDDGPGATAIGVSLTLNSDGTCTQKNGSGVPYAYIDVSKSSLDTVTWTMPGGTAATQPNVTFPTTAPFGSTTVRGGTSSGSASSGTAGNIYSFSSVQVWNANATPPAYATCTNSQAIGVHITQ